MKNCTAARVTLKMEPPPPPPVNHNLLLLLYRPEVVDQKVPLAILGVPPLQVLRNFQSCENRYVLHAHLIDKHSKATKKFYELQISPSYVIAFFPGSTSQLFSHLSRKFKLETRLTYIVFIYIWQLLSYKLTYRKLTNYPVRQLCSKYILLHALPCNTGEYCTSAGMYFHESEGRVKILPARVQYAVLHGNACNKRFILYSCTTLTIAG